MPEAEQVGPEQVAAEQHARAVALLRSIADDLDQVQVSSDEYPAFTVADKSFIFFRSPRKDAVDELGELLPDVICIYVADEDEKQAWIEQCDPLFTTPHFNGHRSVLVRASRLAELPESDLTELVQGAWLARAPKKLAKEWAARNLPT